MKLSEIFKDSFAYPSTSWDKLLILGVLIIVANFATLLPVVGVSLHNIGITGILLTIFFIISLIINLFILGYSFDIIRETISNINVLPEFSAGENLIDGIKVFIITVIYYLIPLIITIVMAFATGTVEKIMKIVLGTDVTNAMAIEIIFSFFAVLLVGLILFTLITTIAIARFAEKGNIGSAFEFSEIFNTISKIGWRNYIIWYVILLIILFVIFIVMGLINIIPILGVIITLLFFYPYVIMLFTRATGLIYNEKNK